MAKKTGATRLAELAGAPPRMASVEDLEAAGPKPSRRYATNRSSSTKKGGELRINLKMVSEALIDEGLDPTVEIIRILKSEVPVRDANGKEKLDPKTKKPIMVPALDADTRMRMMNELLQYTQPKLKSVEMKVSGNLELTSEQLDNRLAMLLSKAAKK